MGESGRTDLEGERLGWKRVETRDICGKLGRDGTLALLGTGFTGEI